MGEIKLTIHMPLDNSEWTSSMRRNWPAFKGKSVSRPRFRVLSNEIKFMIGLLISLT